MKLIILLLVGVGLAMAGDVKIPEPKCVRVMFSARTLREDSLKAAIYSQLSHRAEFGLCAAGREIYTLTVIMTELEDIDVTALAMVLSIPMKVTDVSGKTKMLDVNLDSSVHASTSLEIENLALLAINFVYAASGTKWTGKGVLQ